LKHRRMEKGRANIPGGRHPRGVLVGGVGKNIAGLGGVSANQSKRSAKMVVHQGLAKAKKKKKEKLVPKS